MSDQLERLKSALGGHYRIEHEIGRGGMATVYLAHDLKHGRKVAVKVLQPELAATVGGHRFLREIQTAANAPRSPQKITKNFVIAQGASLARCAPGGLPGCGGVRRG